ncbi:hypothetical protein [Mucilaginibacter sp.]|uniref:hypothetical protein n=1 Tax=Mucilaginibacter sp. TaxID=1882438 RepID=UPI0035BBDC62
MKRILAVLFVVAITGSVSAQKIELTLQANSGLYHYNGGLSASESLILGDGNVSQAYTNNPYGNKNGVSYGGVLQAQMVSRHGFILGLGAGYEVLRSKINVNTYYPNNSPNYNSIAFPASGRTYLQSNFINLNPYIGYRLQFGKVALDVLPGIDIAFKTSEREHGKANYQEGTVTTNRDRINVKHDTRLRIGLAATYGRIGFNASYAHGLVNQAGKMYADPAAQYAYVGNGSASVNDNTAKGELIRFGISYRIF